MTDISKLSERYTVRRMNDADAEDILRFCRENTLYYQYCGADPSKESILNDLHITPPGIDITDKYYSGFFLEDELVAVMDLIDGYPEPDMAFIGFFMVNAALQGKQIGTAIIREMCAYLKNTGKTAVRLAYAEDNPQAGHFWKKNGFLPLDKVSMGEWTAIAAEKKL